MNPTRKRPEWNAGDRAAMIWAAAVALLLLANAGVAPAKDDDEDEGPPPIGSDWEQVHEAPPYPVREYGVAVSHGDHLYLLGGQSLTLGWLSDVWASTDGTEWEQRTGAAPWAPRYQHGVESLDGRIYVMGGSGWGVYNDVWSSEDGREWRMETSAAPWSPRCQFASATFDGRLWVMGGHGEGIRLNDVWASRDGANWELVLDRAPWISRSGHTALAHNGRLILLGGGTFHQQHDRHYFFNDVWATTNGMDWECLIDKAPWEPRSVHGMATLDGHIWITGGHGKWFGTDLRRDVWKSPDGVNWEEVEKAHGGERYTRRSAFAFTAHGGALHLISGSDNAGYTYWPVPYQYRSPRLGE